MVLMWELIERMVYGCDLAKIGCCCLKTSPLLSRICQFSTIAAVDYCFESSFLNTIGEVQTKCQVKSSSLEVSPTGPESWNGTHKDLSSRFFRVFLLKKGLQSKTKEKRCLNFLDISERKIDASSCFVEGGKFTIKFKKVKLLLSLIILLSLKFLPRVEKFVLFCHSIMIIVFIKPFFRQRIKVTCIQSKQPK